MPDWIFNPEVLVYGAGLCYVLGYLFINQVILRVLVLAGTVLYIGYYAIAADEPLWGAIYNSIAIGVANLIGLFQLFATRSKLAIPAKHRDLYPRFAHLSPGDFGALIRRGKRFVTQEELSLGEEGSPSDQVSYIVSGKAKVRKRGENFTIPSGVFIGEVAYLLGRDSSATTIALAGSELIIWSKADLDEHCKRKPRFKLALEAAFSQDMARKVALAVAPIDFRTKQTQNFDTASNAT